jgi:hypothetical protein
MLLRSLQNGHHIVCILSDNNSENKKSFEKLSGGDGKYCSKHSVLEDEKYDLFLAFDSVHVFKNIRNNWLNQNDSEQTFIFPDFPDGNSNDSANVNLNRACFKHSKILHRDEEHKLVKLASALSTKVLNPTNIERLNVKLCVRFFDEKNITALQLKYPEISEGTVKFLNIILSWWKIVNCKSLFEGQHKRDLFQNLIKNMDSPNVVFLKNILVL